MEQAAATAPPLTLASLRALYLIHAEKHYRRRSGSQTREAANIKASIARFEAFAGAAAMAGKINRHQVRAWVDQLAAEKLSRSYCNQCLARLRRMLRWAADLEYIDVAICEQLRLVRPLVAFRSDAKETKHRNPPTLETARAILPHLPRLARDVFQLSMLTGARPGEILGISNAEVHIDSRGPRLCPLQHKAAHHGHARVIPLNTAAVTIVDRHWRPMLPADFLFKSPRSTGHYHHTAYAAAIKRACKKAGVAQICPYDIRHAVGRAVRKAKGLDAAQALLGHANSRMTEIYAPIDAADESTFNTAANATEALQ